MRCYHGDFKRTDSLSCNPVTTRVTILQYGQKIVRSWPEPHDMSGELFPNVVPQRCALAVKVEDGKKDCTRGKHADVLNKADAVVGVRGVYRSV